MAIRPMLAAKLEGNLSEVRLPLLASPKLDGIRAVIIDGKIMSRSMKPIPNEHVQAVFGRHDLNGLDGELILGDPRSASAFRDTTSAVMTYGGTPDVVFHAFDHYLVNGPFHARMHEVKKAVLRHPLISLVWHAHVENVVSILALEEQWLAEGYEGIMLRDPGGRYKFGRSTLREGGLLKLKRFHDSEAVVLGVVERMHNANEAKPDERGYMKRSSHQENKVATGTMGALSVRDLASGVEFEIGTGFSDTDRSIMWTAPPVGKIAKYRYFPTGSKDKPRFPVFNGFRAVEDL